MPPANDDYRKRLAERKRLLARGSQKQQREKAFSSPPKNMPETVKPIKSILERAVPFAFGGMGEEQAKAENRYRLAMMGSNDAQDRVKLTSQLSPTMRAFTEGYGGGGVSGTLARNIGKSAIRTSVENALGNAAGGTVEGLSRFATNLISLGVPLDKKIIRETLDQESLRALGADKYLRLTGPYKIDLTLEPTEKDIKKRINSLVRGTTERLKRGGSTELFDPQTDILTRLESNEITDEAATLLKNLDVPVEESVSTVEALANVPRHLIPDWARFREDNPLVPFRLLRTGPDSKKPFAMGPAGEHPLGVGASQKIGSTTGWTDNPELNDYLFWLHTLPNILKGGISPETFIPSFRRNTPGYAEIVMPKGGYVDESYTKALEGIRRLNPDWLESLKNIDLDQRIKDIGKFK